MGDSVRVRESKLHASQMTHCPNYGTQRSGGETDRNTRHAVMYNRKREGRGRKEKEGEGREGKREGEALRDFDFGVGSYIEKLVFSRRRP